MSFINITKLFKDNGCKLLSRGKHDFDDLLTFECACGIFASKTLLDFNKKPYCSSCNGKPKKQSELAQIAGETITGETGKPEKVKSSMFKIKQFAVGEGRTVSMQGYEIYMFSSLQEIGFKKSQIVVEKEKKVIKTNKVSKNGKEPKVITKSKVPTIRYKHEGEEHRYKPDAYSRVYNLIIEVKSTYTYNNDKSKNKAKLRACQKEGYETLLLIYENGQLSSCKVNSNRMRKTLPELSVFTHISK